MAAKENTKKTNFNSQLITTQPSEAGKENLCSKMSPLLPENSQLCNFESLRKKFLDSGESLMLF